MNELLKLLKGMLVLRDQPGDIPGGGAPAKTYTQEEFENALASRLNREKKSINTSDYKMLQKENELLKKEMRIPAIKEAYLKAGGKDGKAFTDFVKLNEKDLHEVSDLDTTMKVLKTEFDWAFGKDHSTSIDDKGIIKDMLGNDKSLNGASIDPNDHNAIIYGGGKKFPVKQ